MLRLVLLRHGIAIDREDPACPTADADRALTPRGRRRTKQAAQGLAALGLAPTMIWASPLVRARQTAKLARKALDPRGGGLGETGTLEPGRHPQELFDHLAAQDDTVVIAVGHAPHLDHVVAQALGSSRFAITRLKKAGAALLEFPEAWGQYGRLAWVLPPRTLRGLGDTAGGRA